MSSEHDRKSMRLCYVCVSVCVCVCMYVCLYVCMHACNTYIYMILISPNSSLIRLYVSYVCMYVCLHACMHVTVCMYIYTHTPTHTWVAGCSDIGYIVTAGCSKNPVVDLALVAKASCTSSVCTSSLRPHALVAEGLIHSRLMYPFVDLRP